MAIRDGNAQAARAIITDEIRRLGYVVDRAEKYGFIGPADGGRIFAVDLYELKAALTEAQVELARAQALITPEERVRRVRR